MANLTADIARSVWLFNHTELTDRHAREANAEEARELSLFRARHWVKNSYIPEEYPPHKANIEQLHETLMFAAVRYGNQQKFELVSKRGKVIGAAWVATSSAIRFIHSRS